MSLRSPKETSVNKLLNFLFAGFVASAVLTGCAQMQVNDQLKTYKAMLDPLLGSATREYFLERWGIPFKKDTVGRLEVWEFRRSLGMRGSAHANTTYNPYLYGSTTTYAQGQSREAYDDITLTFNENGVLQSWNACVQR
jgi:hypothetical protein